VFSYLHVVKYWQTSQPQATSEEKIRMAAETKKTKKVKNEDKQPSLLDRIREYFADVRSELNKVSWPSREAIISLTRIVLVVLFVFAIGMGGLAAAITLLVEQIGLQQPIVMVVLFAAMLLAAVWWFRRDAQKARY
jgi:preprotein translocase subunit SecE